MTVDVKVFDDLDAVAQDAGGALDRSAQASLYDRLDWLRLTRRHFPTSKPMICRARDGDARAWLFLARDRSAGTAFGSWYTLDFRAVFASDCGRDVKLSLLEAIARDVRRRVATLHLQPLDVETAELLVASFAAAGWRVRHGETSANWVADTSGLMGVDFLERRPSRLRSTLARKARRRRMDIQIADRFDPGHWSSYEEVFARSWKPDEGSTQFLRDLAEQEARVGTLRLGIGRFDGRPVAAQLWLVENGIATIHKLAHDRAEDAASPGTQLTAAMFASVLDRDRPRLVDFGTGDDAYKADWMDRRRPLFTLECANPGSPAGLATMLRWKAAALVRGRATD